MSEVNRDCKECGRWVEDTHEGVPFVDGTAMCMECFEEDYKHIGQKVMDALKRGGLFDEEVETSDEQWFDDPEWIEMNRGEPFEVAWDMVIKMPLYHATSKDAWESIQRQGLKPTAIAPELLDDFGTDRPGEERLRETHGDDFERLFGGEWSFHFGNKPDYDSKYDGNTLAMGNATSRLIDLEMYDQDPDDPFNTGVVLEIDDTHPDAPRFLSLKDLGGWWGIGDDWRRTNQIIPPHIIRQVPREELDAAHDVYMQAFDEMIRGERA